MNGVWNSQVITTSGHFSAGCRTLPQTGEDQIYPIGPSSSALSVISASPSRLAALLEQTDQTSLHLKPSLLTLFSSRTRHCHLSHHLHHFYLHTYPGISDTYNHQSIPQFSLRLPGLLNASWVEVGYLKSKSLTGKQYHWTISTDCCEIVLFFWLKVSRRWNFAFADLIQSQTVSCTLLYSFKFSPSFHEADINPMTLLHTHQVFHVGLVLL